MIGQSVVRVLCWAVACISILKLERSGGMLPQENYSLRLFLVSSESILHFSQDIQDCS